MKSWRLHLIVVLAILGIASTAIGPSHWARADLPPDRPNILLILSDDQAWSTFGRDLMPSVYSQIVDKGVLFSRGYVNESLCCPSRAQIFTGLYGHHTGVDLNTTPLRRPTIIEALHDLGYRTALSGKYLNSWPCDPRPEFDDWFCSGEAESSYSLFNPTINVNGTWVDFKGYTTDIEAQHAVDYINAIPDDQPFFMMYTPTSPHVPANDPRCADNPITPYRPPSYEEDTENNGKPFYMQRGPMTPEEVDAVDHDHEVMTQAVQCLDGSMELLLGGLGQREQNTLVFYMSDNGYLYGEHRRWHKQVPYEEAVRVPFAIRYPPLLPEDQPFVSDALVENVDIAATIADLLGIHWGADGTSLVPILTGQSGKVRNQLLTEYCEGDSYLCEGGELRESGQLSIPSLFSATTSRYVYIEYWQGERELYDLLVDPYQMINLAGNPDYADVQAKMAQRLAKLVAPPPTDTTIVTGPSGVVTTNEVSFTYFSQSRFASYECRLDLDGVEGEWTACGSQAQSYSQLAAGDYTFNVRGTDEHGVTDTTPDTRSFSVDVGVTVAITSGPADPTEASTATFEFTVSDPGATTTCALDGGLAQPCASGVTYDSLQLGSHAFVVQATDPFGDEGPPATWSWTVIQVAASSDVSDFAFKPKTLTVPQGDGVKWTFSGPSNHTVTDATGLGLFDSASQGPGSTFLAQFAAAGKYSYQCTIHSSMVGTVKVPTMVSPLIGGVDTEFTVLWSATPPPSGLVFDVQIKRPGSNRYVNWYTRQTVTSATFVPDAGVGAYSFRARMSNPTTKAATKYSTPVSISVR